MSQDFHEWEYQRVLKYYVCAGCWGHLVAYHAEGRLWRISCPKCGRDRGLLCKRNAEGRKQESRVEARETGPVREEIGHMEKPRPEKTSEQLMRELGF